MAILMIRLIFSVVSTFVFSNKTNILDSALTNPFLSLSLCRTSSNSSCTESDSQIKKSNTPSVQLLPLLSSAKNASISLFVSSNSNACDSLSDHVKVSNKSSIFSRVLSTDIVKYSLLVVGKNAY